MLALSAQVKFLDDILLEEVTKVTCPYTDRFKVGYIVGLFIDQRKKLITKPIRELTDIGYTEMNRFSRISKRNYPETISDNYPAHFLGRVDIIEVHHIHPSDHTNLSIDPKIVGLVGTDESMTSLHGKNWKRKSWTVIRWNWVERYFQPNKVIK